MIEATIRNHLLADAEVVRLTGGRIYPLTAPENASYPLVIYRRSATTRQYHMTGSCGETTATVLLTVFAEPRAGVDQYLEIKQISDAMRLSLDGFTQRNPGSPATGKTQVERVQITAESDEVFAPAHAEGQDSMGVVLTLEVAFSERVRNYM